MQDRPSIGSYTMYDRSFVSVMRFMIKCLRGDKHRRKSSVKTRGKSESNGVASGTKRGGFVAKNGAEHSV